MKGGLALALMLVCALALTGCGGVKQEEHDAAIGGKQGSAG